MTAPTPSIHTLVVKWHGDRYGQEPMVAKVTPENLDAEVAKYWGLRALVYVDGVFVKPPESADLDQAIY